jgi:heat shock protein HslJ
VNVVLTVARVDARIRALPRTTALELAAVLGQESRDGAIAARRTCFEPGSPAMRFRSFVLSLACPIAFAVTGCADQPTTPKLPGAINAPPPPIDVGGDSLLTGTVWAWQGTTMSDGAKIVPDAPERYTLEFQPGGQATVRADCNRGATSYLLNDVQLTFGPIALTKMACPPGSRDAEFLKELAVVASQRFQGYELVLTLRGNSGSMRFTTTRQ